MFLKVRERGTDLVVVEVESVVVTVVVVLLVVETVVRNLCTY